MPVFGSLFCSGTSVCVCTRDLDRIKKKAGQHSKVGAGGDENLVIKFIWPKKTPHVPTVRRTP